MFTHIQSIARAAVALSMLLVAAVLMPPESASATTTCTFTMSGSTMTLDADCTTDVTILIPDGMTLDGKGHTITAVDPPGDHFRGAVVANEGTTANVEHLTVTADSLSNACDNGADRLRGIMFEGASGTIAHNTVIGVNQGASGCQEGNAIEVRNAPFDGTHPNTQTVEIAHNSVLDYQKTGIVANGDVDVDIHHNEVGASATQDDLAANSVQLGFGALGSVTQNRIDGNQWKGTSNFAGSAILVFHAESSPPFTRFTMPVHVSQNTIRGNSDVGLLIAANDGTYNNNRVFDVGPDHPNSLFDVGVWDSGTGNSVTNNKVRGFDFPYFGVTGGNNKTIPSPHQ